MASEMIPIDPAIVQHYVNTLAQYGAVGETGVSRLVYSPAWVAAQDQVAQWCQEAGLTVHRDAVGNVWGRLEGSEGGPSIVSGSHIDSQNPGGRFDGALGVIAAVLAIRTLKERFGQPRRTLEVLSFCEEEASRFPEASFWGSRAITGKIEAGTPETLLAYTGETMADAMRAVGLDPERIPEARRDDIDTFIELHIEQGPILEAEELPVGIVTALPGIRHYLVGLHGRADHAGAMPMDLRLDPMAGAAEMITGILDIANTMGRPAVTTVGRVLVEPNYPAIVPERVSFTIDARHTNPDARAELYNDEETLIRRVAERRGLDVTIETTFDLPPCPSNPSLVALLESAAQDQGVQALSMPSGAVHDTQRMAEIAKVAMIFVQSKDGRSHTPAEYTAPEHAAAGIQVLAAALKRLAY